MNPIPRRDFLRRAGGLTTVGLGYSVFVDATTAQPPEQRPSVIDASIGAAKQADAPRPAHSEPHMTRAAIDCDVLVAGGGMAGVCAALAAARHGAKVVLIQDRSRLGGNASSEIRMHIVGADCHGSRAGWRESGILEEIRLDDAVTNPHRAFELWDLLLYDKCIFEPNLTLLLDTIVFRAETARQQIRRAWARCDKTETLYEIRAKVFCDCTGDCRLALEAGAEFRRGREAKSETGEPLALDAPDLRSQGSSILFTAREHDEPIPYRPPSWARKITKEHLKFRPVHSWEYGYWWIELGGMYDTIRDNEQLRFELLSIVLGVWDYIKNSGRHRDSTNWALETVGMIPGKRESRRILGEHIMTQMDLEGGWKSFDDGVAVGGWNLDEHPPEGFDAPDKRPFKSVRLPEPYNIPLGALYSRNISNLMMAGRNISSTHVAFTSARVMGTCSVIGQAVGTAAAYCARHGLRPARLRSDKNHLKQYQQTLLRDDQTIRGIRNEDENDLARRASASASSNWNDARPEHVLDGFTRDEPGSLAHRWASADDDPQPWIELRWDQPVRIGYVQITFDSGFHRELTLSASNWVTKGTVRAPQPETVRTYHLTGVRADGSQVELAAVDGNHQRLVRHSFETEAIQSLRLSIDATNGAKNARIYEIRCYKHPPV